MKIIQLLYLFLFCISNFNNMANAESAEIILEQLPSSPNFLKIKKVANTNLQSCQSDIYNYDSIISDNTAIQSERKISLTFLDDTTKATLNKMSSGVFRHVSMQVAASLLSFNSNALSSENIAKYISDGTQDFLPLIYANGVMVTAVRSKGNRIIYRTEMPITKYNIIAAALAAAGRESAISAICDDMEQINDLLEQKIIIQYDYYDSTGAFYSSFSLNGV